jgi:hypothetical protein
MDLKKTNKGDADDTANDVDLYDDLDETIRAAATGGPPSKKIKRNQNDNIGLSSLPPSSVMKLPPSNQNNIQCDDSNVSLLHEQIRKLQEENNILKRNIGILFRTAKNEIQRKDNQIHELLSFKK